VGEIQPGAVRAAAGAIEQVAQAVRSNVPDEVGGVAGALTGSASGAAGTTLATTWTDAYRAWATSAEAHAQSMRDAAAAWERTNQDVATSFDRIRPRAV
jgi:hypothetical protein